MRLFTCQLYSGQLDSVAIYTPARYNSLLGAAESVELELFVTVVSGSSTVISCNRERSNDNVNWVPDGSPFLKNEPISPNVTTEIVFSDVLGAGQVRTAFIRYQLYLSGTTPVAHVVFTACGRADELLQPCG